jgi:hypothetical protein
MGRNKSEAWTKYKPKAEWERDSIHWRLGNSVPSFRQNESEYVVEDGNGTYVSGTTCQAKSAQFIACHQAALEILLQICGAGEWILDITVAPKDGSMVLLAWEIPSGIDCGVDRWDSSVQDWTLRVVPFAWAGVNIPTQVV